MQQQLELIQEVNNQDRASNEVDPKATTQIVALMMQAILVVIQIPEEDRNEQ